MIIGFVVSSRHNTQNCICVFVSSSLSLDSATTSFRFLGHFLYNSSLCPNLTGYSSYSSPRTDWPRRFAALLHSLSAMANISFDYFFSYFFLDFWVFFSLKVGGYTHRMFFLRRCPGARLSLSFSALFCLSFVFLCLCQCALSQQKSTLASIYSFSQALSQAFLCSTHNSNALGGGGGSEWVSGRVKYL